jgi:hypothetical protein
MIKNIFVFINEKMEMFISEKHEFVFTKYEKEKSQNKAIYELNNNVLKMVNSPLSFFEKKDIELKGKFENKINQNKLLKKN